MTRGLSRSGALILTVLAASVAARAQAPPAGGSDQAAVSPDGSRIAFMSGGDIYVVSPDGTGKQQVTQTPEEKGSLAWLSSGTLVFDVSASDTSRLYAIATDGTHRRLLATVPGRNPVLSPDGTRVLSATGSWTATKLIVSALDGAAPHQITDGSSIAWNYRWSPDGTRIAYTGQGANRTLHVFLMNADGSEVRQLTHLAPDEGRAQVPAWSTDGRQIAMQASQHSASGDTGHVWIVDVATGAARKLAAHDARYQDEVPSWFPDGKRLAFQSDRTGRMEIWVMNADGSGQRQITK